MFDIILKILNMTKVKNQKKYDFMLKNVDTVKIEEIYDITIVSNITDLGSPLNITKITELTTKLTPNIMSFLDESKKIHKCMVSMIDHQTNKEIISNKNYYCYWCRHSIPSNILPIGCPIKFIPNKAIKSYYSEISKDKYTIKENITENRKENIDESKDTRITTLEKNYYLTDGIFCSFNCCLSYILDNNNNSMYNMSKMLLLKIYNDIYPDINPFIEYAPHWRKLIVYGGDLTIEKFRNSFNKIEYKNHGTINPRFKSLGVLFEEKLKL